MSDLRRIRGWEVLDLAKRTSAAFEEFVQHVAMTHGAEFRARADRTGGIRPGMWTNPGGGGRFSSDGDSWVQAPVVPNPPQ